jgi:hypothetical protein
MRITIGPHAMFRARTIGASQQETLRQTAMPNFSDRAVLLGSAKSSCCNRLSDLGWSDPHYLGGSLPARNAAVADRDAEHRRQDDRDCRAATFAAAQPQSSMRVSDEIMDAGETGTMDTAGIHAPTGLGQHLRRHPVTVVSDEQPEPRAGCSTAHHDVACVCGTGVGYEFQNGGVQREGISANHGVRAGDFEIQLNAGASERGHQWREICQPHAHVKSSGVGIARGAAEQARRQSATSHGSILDGLEQRDLVHAGRPALETMLGGDDDTEQIAQVMDSLPLRCGGNETWYRCFAMD